jgi:hypothetical protein
MGKLTGAVISGLIFGAVAVALMWPMQFPDKRTALLGAFASRFALKTHRLLSGFAGFASAIRT